MYINPKMDSCKGEWHESYANIVSVVFDEQNGWYGVMCCEKKTTDYWVKKCMECEVEGSRSRGRPKRTWWEVVQKDCQARNLKREDAMDRGRWKKLIKIGWWSSWWAGECLFWYWLTRVILDKGPQNGCCCCCCCCCWRTENAKISYQYSSLKKFVLGSHPSINRQHLRFFHQPRCYHVSNISHYHSIYSTFRNTLTLRASRLSL